MQPSVSSSSQCTPAPVPARRDSLVTGEPVAGPGRGVSCGVDRAGGSQAPLVLHGVPGSRSGLRLDMENWRVH